ncbi:hypothetical protein [Pseudomonas sp.]|uniref:hypothetical protein n=1 Tax=Pseudomonas sp. TaxID=306 RepID=UPI00290E96DE|nr:hypothetical protein [Pseudomonas sp.]MDU4251943.1 hypothetical protein [Pseudomonas sp.]
MAWKDVSSRVALGKAVFGYFVGLMTILPALHWLYGLLYGKDGGFQGFLWAGTVTLVIFSFAGLFLYCSACQAGMQGEIDRMSTQKEKLEALLLKRRLSSKKGR